MQYDDEELRRLQLAELDILVDIDRLCRKLGIAYFLDSGTLLGAVRHGGFIPWDDDIDVGMLRSDYERFRNAVLEGALGEGYVASSPESSEVHAGMFVKVWRKGTKFYTRETIEAGIPQGIFVDVFPYDELSGDEGMARKQMRRCRLWQSLSYLCHAKSIVVPHQGVLGSAERVLCRAAHEVVSRMFSHERICESFNRFALLGRGSGSGVYAIMPWTWCGTFPHDVLAPCSTVLFEGREFSAPARPKEYLAIMYGDTWRELPPVDQRKNHAPIELDFGYGES